MLSTCVKTLLACRDWCTPCSSDRSKNALRISYLKVLQQLACLRKPWPKRTFLTVEGHQIFSDDEAGLGRGWTAGLPAGIQHAESTHSPEGLYILLYHKHTNSGLLEPELLAPQSATTPAPSPSTLRILHLIYYHFNTGPIGKGLGSVDTSQLTDTLQYIFVHVGALWACTISRMWHTPHPSDKSRNSLDVHYPRVLWQLVSFTSFIITSILIPLARVLVSALGLPVGAAGFSCTFCHSFDTGFIFSHPSSI